MKAQLLLRRTFCSGITTGAITPLSRIGQIHEDMKPFWSCDSNSVASWNSMVERSIISWNSWLVSKYMRNGQIDEARKGFDDMIHKNVASWTDMVKGFVDNGKVDVTKSPGCSWTEVGDKVHPFTSGDTNGIHPDQESMVKILDELDGLLKEAGYNPEGNKVYSERLAIAFSLLKLPEGEPIHVTKSLRVSMDSHAAIKIISKVKEREIILRDANGIHHFKNGVCSCKDRLGDGNMEQL